jgi:hypothetical protein
MIYARLTDEVETWRYHGTEDMPAYRRPACGSVHEPRTCRQAISDLSLLQRVSRVLQRWRKGVCLAEEARELTMADASRRHTLAHPAAPDSPSTA